LPALPSAWPDGEVKGLRARGGFEVDMRWAGGHLVDATVRAVAGDGAANVRYGEGTVALKLRPGESCKLARAAPSTALHLLECQRARPTPNAGS
jgi:alpha-L-fucosidase 2